MTSRFPWFKSEERALAHEYGPADFVSYVWSRLQKAWNPEETCALAVGFRKLDPLIQEAAKRPELRQLRPFTSHFSRGFSRTTGYPFSRDCPYARPAGEDLYQHKGEVENNLYRVTSADGTVLCDRVDVVRAERDDDPESES